MNKLTITLKQHTPIVHFQHEQEGATLRATEVKPKLDRFIVNEFSKYWKEEAKEFEQEISEVRRCLESGTPSSYKLCIQNGAEIDKYELYYFDNVIPEKSSYPRVINSIINNLGISSENIIYDTPFFSNRDKQKNNLWKEVKVGKLNRGEIFLSVFSYNPKMIKLLEQTIPKLLVLENSGNRQSKGFGCFLPNSFKSSNEIVNILNRKYKIIKYNIKTSGKNTKDIFNEINLVYKNLKNFSLKRGESKSLIKDYYYNQQDQSEKIYWEKELMSEFAYEAGVPVNEGEFYVRAILGLANLYDYPEISKMLTISDVEIGSGDKIERFKSPLFFKVYYGTIYLVCNDVPLEILNHKFEFRKNDTEKMTIATPWYFDKDEFIKLLTWKSI